MNQVIRGKTLSLTGVREHPDFGWAAGEYSFESSAFFPIDSEYPNEAPDFYPEFKQVGWGNQGREHNFHFCTEIHTAFAYYGFGQFNFAGDDDVWIFINNRLAIDLGGVHGEKAYALDLAKFCPDDVGCLQNNTEYPLDVFHCERQTQDSNFKMTTLGIQLFTVGRPPPPPGKPLDENSMPDSKRALVGISNRMPGPDWGYGPRDYVLVGADADWISAPVTLTLDSKDYDVVSETYDKKTYNFMARGLALAAGSVEATITCEDGTVVACVINVQTVW